MNIYRITNNLDGKIYIGQEKRNNPKYYGSGNLIIEAIKIYGKENFTKDILESNIENSNELNNREKYWINKLNSRDPLIGYNLSAGGSSYYMSPEIAKKISDNLKGKYVGERAFRHGIRLTQEHKDRISIANSKINRTVTPETRKKMSESRMGFTPSEESRRKMSISKTGCILSPEHKNKISSGLKGHICSSETKNKLSKSNRNKTQKHSSIVTAISENAILNFANISEASRYFECTRFRIRENKVLGWDISINKKN